MDFEDVLAQVGCFGKYQKILILYLIPVSILSSMLSNQIFLQLTPDHWCSVPEIVNFSFGEQHRFIRPVLLNTNSQPVMDSCSMFDINYKIVANDLRLPVINDTKHEKISIKSCENGWIYDRTHYWDSAVMQFDFVCEQSNGFELISNMRLIGSICGTPLFGILSDIFGRRVGYTSVLITAIISSISPLIFKDHTVFLISQFIVGLTYPSITEFMGSKYRASVAVVLWISLYLGTCVQSIISYLIPHWIWIIAINTVIVILIMISIMIIPESIQWLIVMNRDDSVQQHFEHIMKVNGESFDLDLLEMQIQKIGKYKKKLNDENEKNKNKLIKYVKDSTIFHIFLIILFCFTINLMTNRIFESKKLTFNNEILINTIFWSLIKIPSILIAWAVIQSRSGRRLTNTLIITLIGLTLIGLGFIPKSKSVLIYGLYIFGIFMNDMLLMINYIQVIEFSPTKIRCTALSISTSVATLIVSVFYYVYDLKNFENLTPIIILSIICLLIGFLSSFLCETHNENMCRTMGSTEELINNMTYWSVSKCRCDLKSNIFVSLSKWDMSEFDDT